ncbi:MAG TPA: superoxide dismutase family protein [Gemmatimonadaceae bacterium]
MRASAVVVALFVVAGCHRSVQVGSGPAASASAVPFATAALQLANGQSAGTISFSSSGSSVSLSGDVTGLTAGQHGIHFHAVGKCEGPAFTTAGGHVNPMTKKHGLKNPDGPHAGDLDNITADASGHAHVSLMTDRVTAAALMDADGSAIIVHAAVDDQMTDPSGNSGARFACGVIQKR